MGFHKLANTQYFREAARDFISNGGYYTRAPEGSREYQQYWDMWEERCKNGMSTGGLWVPGRHVFYMNFTPIMKIADGQIHAAMKEARGKGGQISKMTMERILDFPRFYEIDYEWYNFKNIAWFGGSFMGVESPGAQHLVCAKARGAGFSFKEASDGVYNFTFIPRSKSYYFAALEQYLSNDGILNKAKDMLDFINDHCPEWKQNRVKSDQVLKMKASYMDERGVERGNMAEMLGVVINNPNKTRGKRGRKVTFEEAGSFTNLKKALKVSLGSIKDGGVTVGQISVFGTGGEEGPSIEGLEDIFSNPREYEMLAFPNVYEDGMEETEIGYFVPATRTNPVFMDEEGNVDMRAAYDYELEQREREKRKPDPKEYDGYIAEYPIFPSEVFQRVTVNPFMARELKAHIQRIQRSSTIQSLLRHGDFIGSGPKLKFVAQPKNVARPIENYPHTREDNLEGCVTIAEEPFRDQKGHVPRNMYKVVFDPYYKEESDSVTSLFCIHVLKLYNSIDPKNQGLPVAWFRGRPQDLDRAYRILFDLADWYNTDVQGEIAGGGQGVLDYAKRLHLLEKVCFEPESLNNKEIDKGANRRYLMNMATERKRIGLTYLVDWHAQVRHIGEDGRKYRVLHQLYDIVACKEMLKFDGKKNADSISSLVVGMFELREEVYRQETQRSDERRKDDFLNRPLYVEVEDYDSETTTSY